MCSSIEMVTEFSVVKNGKSFFDAPGACYVVPIYQRAFAWGVSDDLKRENELVQLVYDLFDFGKRATTDNYYLGSLVVKERECGEFEVIDGQQRLTALYILFTCLGVNIENPSALVYESREWSTKTLRNLRDLSVNAVNNGEVDHVIYEGYRTLAQLLAGMSADDRKLLTDTLPRVLLFRILVPEGTDLNHYFEIMNTRGEQLEPQDIVKAKLMQPLDDAECVTFARVWDICSDMSGYVQMKFSREERELLFGVEWNDCPRQIGVSSIASQSVPCTNLAMLLTSGDTGGKDVCADGDDDVERTDLIESKVRFSPIVDFPHFLMHVLRVMTADGGNLLGGELDDKLLIREFEEAVKRGRIGENAVSPRDLSWKFLECLLACRFLFDKFIVKRESATGDASQGEWSLKELVCRSYYGKKSADYALTRSCDDSTEANIPLMMIESCLRVSYTAPKTMHWITELLALLYKSRCSVSLSYVLAQLELRAAQAVNDEYLKADKTHRMGLATPRIVFNYLDYLLWKKDRPTDFTFEFRNSIEHWYPRHPENMAIWDTSVEDENGERRLDRDRIGNLCLLTTRMNSRFSNLPPEAKASYYGEKKESVSLKFVEMRKLTLALSQEIGADTQVACRVWREKTCEAHEREMLDILYGDQKEKGLSCG